MSDHPAIKEAEKLYDPATAFGNDRLLDQLYAAGECERCFGTGWSADEESYDCDGEECPWCDGTGRKYVEEHLQGDGGSGIPNDTEYGA